MASIGLTLVTQVVLRIVPIALLGSTSISLIASLAGVAPIGMTRASVGPLVRSSLLLALARCLTFGSNNRCWTRNIFGRIVSVELLVNGLWDGCYLGTEFLLDPVEIEAIIPIDQVDRYSQVSKPSRSANAMEVGLCILWEIEVDDYVDSLYIDTACKKI